MSPDGNESKGGQQPLHRAAAETTRSRFACNTVTRPRWRKRALTKCARPRAQQRSTRRHAGKLGTPLLANVAAPGDGCTPPRPSPGITDPLLKNAVSIGDPGNSPINQLTSLGFGVARRTGGKHAKNTEEIRTKHERNTKRIQNTQACTCPASGLHLAREWLCPAFGKDLTTLICALH